MSDYTAPTIHPRTGEVEEAMWMDNHFGRHRYGVKFSDGTIWPQEKVKVPKRYDLPRLLPDNGEIT